MCINFRPIKLWIESFHVRRASKRKSHLRAMRLPLRRWIMSPRLSAALQDPFATRIEPRLSPTEAHPANRRSFLCVYSASLAGCFVRLVAKLFLLEPHSKTNRLRADPPSFSEGVCGATFPKRRFFKFVLESHCRSFLPVGSRLGPRMLSMCGCGGLLCN
jgi:hypothetical protein